MRALALGLSLLAVAASAHASESIEALLAAVTAAQRFPIQARADVQLERVDGEQTTTSDVVLAGRGHTLYVETRDGLRALVRPSKQLVLEDGRIVRAGLDTPVGQSDLMLEDLVPVTLALFRVPQMSDDGPTGTVVTGAPTGRTGRALLVLTIDPVTHTVARAKIYERSVSELAAFRRDDEFVEVAGRPRPTRIVLERIRERTTTRGTLAWRPAPELPQSLWTPAGLLAPSPIRW
jgi:hypothetical protein